MSNGVHTTYDVSNTLECLKEQGKTFIGRYFAVENTWKAIKHTEAQNISNTGLYVISIWEDSKADNPGYFAYDQGKSDGYNAFNYAINLGQSEGSPVYFAVDFDATTEDKQNVLDYFNGIHSGYLQYFNERQRAGESVVTYKIGVYGSYDVLTWCDEQGIVTYFFQAYAQGWSDKRNSNPWPGYHLRQTSPNQSLCSIRVNLDISNGAAGGWML